MNAFKQELSTRLDELRDQGLHRELRQVRSSQGPRIQLNETCLLNFSSNDYLGLASSPLLKEAAIKAVETFGAGSGASRLISGSLTPHHLLEEALCEFKGAEAALTFTSGYAAALGTISAIAGSDDVVVLDKLVHASIVDAARLSGAKLRVFRHNDVNSLEDILKWCDKRRQTVAASPPQPRILVVTESIFSMDGDHAPLNELVELKEKHGAWLMVDEAHASGLYGLNRRGLGEHFGVAERIDIQMGTLGKALGSSGGFICGSQKLIEYLVHCARSFVFSTAPVPAAAAAAEAAIRFVQSPAGEAQCRLLWERVAQVPRRFKPSGCALPSAIIPLLVGAEEQAVAASRELFFRGLFVPAIRYPTVARGKARLRLTLSAAHSAAEVSQLVTSIEEAFPGDPLTEVPAEPGPPRTKPRS
jgi:8-amino-7-oxononanoate synthase